MAPKFVAVVIICPPFHNARMNRLLISNARLVNEGRIRDVDILIEGDRIARIDSGITAPDAAEVIDAGGKYLLPGMIDDQVHFREPGLTHKGDLATESAAAAAGGITSFMDMPNVNPLTTTREALAAKYALAAERCTGNYGFYLGATNSNIDEIQALAPTLRGDCMQEGLAYTDAVADDALLTLSVAATGFAYGGLVLTRAAVREALRGTDGRIDGVPEGEETI